MIFKPETAQKTAELLLQIQAIKLSPNKPFTWASGWLSPIYCDNRLVLSYPIIRNYIRKEMASCIEEKFGKPDVIAGVATGAIGMGMLVASFMGLPFVYVRPEPKSHGRQNQIEGALQSGQHVVVVEDLISTGRSSLSAVAALKDSGARVMGMVAIFTYGFTLAEENFKSEKLALFTMSNYSNLLDYALATDYIAHKDQKILSEWNKNPAAWGLPDTSK